MKKKILRKISRNKVHEKTCNSTCLFAILYRISAKQTALKKYITKGGKRNGIIKRMAQTCL